MPNMVAPVAPGTQLTSGSPEYQAQIIEQRRRAIVPQYAQAVQKARQVQANRGLINSGLGGEREQELGQEERGVMQNVASQAATQGADVAEQNRRQQIADALALRMQGNQFNQQNQMLAKQQDEENRQKFNDLIGGVAGVAGGVGGNLLARQLFPDQFGQK